MNNNETSFSGVTKGQKIKFSLLQFTFWCSWCAFTSFVALYLKNIGLSKAQIGFALSVSTLSGILGQLFWGYLCDRFKAIRRNFVAANIMIWAVVIGFIFVKGPLLAMILMALLGFAQVPQPSILDTWILKRLSNREGEYGHIRLWASIGFAIFALGFGKVLDSFGFSALFIAPSFFLLITLVLSFFTPDIKEDDKEKKSIKEAFSELLKNKRFRYFIIICFLIGLAARTTHLLLPLIIDAVKGNATYLGLALFITGITEIPMLILSKKLSKKLKPLHLIMISAFFYFVQFTLLFLAKTILLVLIAMVFQGLAFGNLLPSIRLFVHENSPEKLRTTAQAITDGIYSSLAGVIGTASGGLIIQNFGLRFMVAACGLLVVSAFFLLLIKIKSYHRKNA